MSKSLPLLTSFEKRLAKDRPRHVTIVAGEASGDAHAASVVAELRKRDPTLQFSGMGGQALAAQGVEMIIDSTRLAVVGLVEVLSRYPQIRRALKALEQHIAARRPDLLILVDYVEFNLRLARAAKRMGIRVLFYVSPQVWAWRPGRIKKIGRSIDAIAVLFPFEEELYRRHGIAVRYVGNPLVDQVIAPTDPLQVRSLLGLSAQAKVIGLFPGSRPSEVRRHLPVMVEAARLMQARTPDLQFVVGIAPGIDEKTEIDPWLAQEFEIRKSTGQSHGLMSACDAIMVASGTATLEAGLLQTPMAIMYKVSPLSHFFLKRFLLIPNIGLVNIVAGKRIVQEFIQSEATPSALAHEMTRLILDAAYREGVKQELAQVRLKLGEPGSAARVAEMADQLMRGSGAHDSTLT